MTFNRFSYDYPYENEYFERPGYHYIPGYNSAYIQQLRRQREQQLRMEEERRRLSLQQQRAYEIERARQEQLAYQRRLQQQKKHQARLQEQQRQEQLRQMILEEKQQQETQQEKMFHRRPVIVRGTDGNLYQMFIDDREKTKMTDQYSKAWQKMNTFTKSEDIDLTPKQSEQSVLEGNQNHLAVEISDTKEAMKLADVMQKKHGEIEVEDASDDESEDFSQNNHLYPGEGESWMEPVKQ